MVMEESTATSLFVDIVTVIKGGAIMSSRDTIAPRDDIIAPPRRIDGFINWWGV